MGERRDRIISCMPVSRLSLKELQFAIEHGIVRPPTEDCVGSCDNGNAVTDKTGKRLDLGKKGVMDLPDSVRKVYLGNKFGNQYPVL